MSDTPDTRDTPDTVELEAVELEFDENVPTLYVNVDVNDLLEDRTEEQVLEFLGKLKDLLA